MTDSKMSTLPIILPIEKITDVVNNGWYVFTTRSVPRKDSSPYKDGTIKFVKGDRPIMFKIGEFKCSGSPDYNAIYIGKEYTDDKGKVKPVKRGSLKAYHSHEEYKQRDFINTALAKAIFSDSDFMDHIGSKYINEETGENDFNTFLKAFQGPVVRAIRKEKYKDITGNFVKEADGKKFKKRPVKVKDENGKEKTVFDHHSEYTIGVKNQQVDSNQCMIYNKDGEERPYDWTKIKGRSDISGALTADEWPLYEYGGKTRTRCPLTQLKMGVVNSVNATIAPKRCFLNDNVEDDPELASLMVSPTSDSKSDNKPDSPSRKRRRIDKDVKMEPLNPINVKKTKVDNKKKHDDKVAAAIARAKKISVK